MNSLYASFLVTLLGFSSALHAGITFELKNGDETKISRASYVEFMNVVQSGVTIISNKRVSLGDVTKESFEFLINHLNEIKNGQLRSGLDNYYKASHNNYRSMIDAAVFLGITNILNEALLFQGRCWDEKGLRADVEKLITHGADINTKDSGFLNVTPLMHAAMQGKEEMVKVLLEKGAQIDIEDTGLRCWTAFRWACSSEDIKIAELLLAQDSTQIDLTDKKNQTALQVAIDKLHANMAMFLHAKGAQFDSKDASYGKKFRDAALGGKTAMVEFYSKAGIDLNVQDDKGMTALMNASMTGGAETVKLLIKAGANLDIQNHSGCTALMVAATMARENVVEVLLAANARVDIKASQGWTAKEYATRISVTIHNNAAASREQARKRRAIKDLLNKAASEQSGSQKNGITLKKVLIVALTCYMGYRLYKYYNSQKDEPQVTKQVPEEKDDLKNVLKPDYTSHSAS